MLEIEDQLRRYGEGLERELLDQSNVAAVDPGPDRRRSRRRVFLAAAALMVVAAAGAAAIVALTSNEKGVSTGPATPTEDLRAGVFSTVTNAVLLFSDGIDGATAIDLDRRLAGRRVIDGERAGDQPFRLTLTGDHLVVGWGEIYAAPLSGGPSRMIADATIYIPASEPGEVWTLTWPGGRIGAGAAVLERLSVDGSVVYASTDFDTANLQVVIGVPGGLVVNTPDGVAVWDADTGATGPILGPGPATAAASDGRSLAWCESDCSSFHVVELSRTGPPTAPHVAAGQQIALSGDEAHAAVLRPKASRADLIVIDQSTSEEFTVATDLDPTGALQWTPDGRQLFYTERSYQESSMTVGRYDLRSQRWEIETLPVGDSFAAIVVDRDQTRSFFAPQLVAAGDCRGGGNAVPSGRQGVCTFAFFTPDSPEECVADGRPIIEVPDGVGLAWIDAAIRIQQAGLNVVGTGTPTGDPTGEDAVVRSQEPPAGSHVPEGACIGFRTSG